MPHLSLTDFVDVVMKAGTPKLTKIRQIKDRPPYNPATDFWRPLRQQIVEAHQSGRGRSHVGEVVKGLADKKKRTAYPPLIKAYSKWWGRKDYHWFDPPGGTWRAGAVSVGVNPELGLVLDDQRLVIKLYFKAEKLTKNRVDVILHLMEDTLRADAPGAVMAVHDIQGGRLIIPSGPVLGIEAMLSGEAAYVESVWRKLR